MLNRVSLLRAVAAVILGLAVTSGSVIASEMILD
jgi:hypothetical protein